MHSTAAAPRIHERAAPIHVVATTLAGTREAVETASAMAQRAGARVHVIAVQPLREAVLESRSGVTRALALNIGDVTERSSAPIDVLPCICRSLTDVAQLLPRRAIVVIAGPSRRWWPTAEQRLAHDLHRLGCRVTFIPIANEQAPHHDG
jgi:hypothetical protein